MIIGSFLAVVAFGMAATLSPGPNNLMLMASGANFGFRRTVPHMLGIGTGFPIMILLVGLGLVQLFDLYPVIYTVLKTVSVIYLVWLAWKIATAAAPQEMHSKASAARPLSYLQAALFQWVNPKAWSMALSAITLYAPERQAAAVAMVALAFALVSVPSVTVWTAAGLQLARLLNSPLRLRFFNAVMALLLLSSLYPVLISIGASVQGG